jgi:hypothetical protein
MYHGDIRLGDTIDIKFTTRAFATGAPTTLAGSPSVAAYPGNSTTEITAGITLSVDFDSRTGLNNVRIVASGGNGYVTATNYTLVITAGTVSGTSVVSECVGSFSIEARSALMPTTAARTLVVDANGLADANAVKVGPTGSGTAQTAGDLAAMITTVDDFVDTEVTAIKTKTDFLPSATAGAAGGLFIAGTNAPVTITGSGDALTLTSTGGNGTGLKTSGNGSGDGIQAVAGLVGGVPIRGAITGNLNGAVTGSVGSVTGAVGSVTGNVGGNVVGSVASVTAGVTVTTNNDKTGYSLAAAYDLAKTAAQAGDAMALTAAYNFAKGTTAMTESYAANGVAPTPVQAILGIHQMLMQFGISGTSYTVKKLDNATTAFVVTLDDAVNPSAAVRT